MLDAAGALQATTTPPTIPCVQAGTGPGAGSPAAAAPADPVPGRELGGELGSVDEGQEEEEGEGEGEAGAAMPGASAPAGGDGGGAAAAAAGTTEGGGAQGGAASSQVSAPAGSGPAGGGRGGAAAAAAAMGPGGYPPGVILPGGYRSAAMRGRLAEQEARHAADWNQMGNPAAGEADHQADAAAAVAAAPPDDEGEVSNVSVSTRRGWV